MVTGRASVPGVCFVRWATWGNLYENWNNKFAMIKDRLRCQVCATIDKFHKIRCHVDSVKNSATGISNRLRYQDRLQYQVCAAMDKFRWTETTTMIAPQKILNLIMKAALMNLHVKCFHNDEAIYTHDVKNAESTLTQHYFNVVWPLCLSTALIMMLDLASRQNIIKIHYVI